MAKINVEIKSKDIIKPISETPDHLKTLKFSLMDQFTPPVHTPFIFFYQTQLGQFNNSQTTTLLKNSLSETLVQFYPLAGRITEGNLTINCNDEGVEYYEAHVLETLAQVTANPDPEELINLLPFPPLNTDKRSIVTAVQVNHFSCGAIAISVNISHKIVDAATFFAFVNAWAVNARGVSINDDQPKLVTFDSASFFPPMDLNGMFDDEGSISKEKVVTKWLVFDKEKLDELKRQCDDVTSVTMVCAWLWKKFIKIAKAKPTPLKIFGALQIVNLRTIKDSPIPLNYCGNLFGPTFVQTTVEPEIEYSEAVRKLRTAVEQVDTSYIPKVKTGECYMGLLQVYQMGAGEADTCAFSSWTGFPMYEVNFGWGKPIWVSSTSLPFKNSVVLMPTKCGQGIEAWVNLLETDVAAFEDDHEFRSLASRIV